MARVILIVLLTVFASHAVILRNQSPHLDHLTKKELMQIFGVADREKIPNFEVVTVREPNSHRSKRSDDDIPASLIVKAFGTELTLNLTLNKDFIAKSHTIEIYGADGKVRKYNGVPGRFVKGVVHGDPYSHVALEQSKRGVSGLIRTADNVYMINRFPGKLSQHVMYRKSDLPQDHPLHSLKCGNEEFEKRDNYPRRNRRSIRPKKTMELMIAADYTMVEWYSLDILPSYMLSVANIMSSVYRDSSLSYQINVVVVRTAIFETNKFNAPSISNLLANFSTWARKNNIQDENDPDHVDNQMLLTRNGCGDGCALEGLAYDSLCGQSAQSVTKDRGLMSALTAAHEVAHNLGVGHDGTDECPDGLNIMATGAASGSTSLHWSTCSALKITSILESEQSFCYNDEPSTSLSNSTFELYGTVYNADKQCQFTFGPNFGKCAYYENRCDRLYCQEKGTGGCVALSYPPVQGTYCGPHKWCIYGECVPDGTDAPNPINGQWGEWSDYTSCNQDCGIGVQWRNRSCDNPAPAHGGQDCVGHNKGHYKTCNTESCPSGSPSFRKTQCQAINREYTDFFDGNQQCQLVCGSATAAYYFGHVTDGTQCIPGSREKDLCINGECKSVGCDLQLNSDSVYDRCKVCKGDGSSCQLYTGNDTNEYATQGQYHLTDISAQSLDISVKELGGTFNFLGFKVGNASNLAIGLPAYSSTYNLEGTKIYYDMEGWYYPDQIRVVDKLPKPIRVFLVNYYQVKSEGVAWRYYGPVTTSEAPPTYAWKPMEWSSCSKSCAGGTQTRHVHCIRTDDSSAVKNVLCSHLERQSEIQPCNLMDCPALWHLTEWTTCSKSCGNGSHTRQLYCARATSDSGQKEVADVECNGEKPVISTFERCNEIMCAAEWSVSAWSACSKSCGGGTNVRTVSCKRINRDGNVINVSKLECSYAPEPAVTLKCNLDVLCPTWKVVYSECSVTCGGGTKTPSVVCAIETTDEKLDESKCDAATKIDESSLENKECGMESCSLYHWVVQESKCSVTCGAGLISITVQCQNKRDKTVVDDVNCSDQVKPTPSSTKECDTGVCPEEYLWKTKFSDCSKTCGGGTKSIIPHCVKKSDGTVVSDLSCDASIKPSIHTEACAEIPCPITVKWHVVDGECSVTCGNGTRPVTAVCKRDNDGSTVDDTFCMKITKPDLVEKDCDMGECPPTYSWKQVFSDCSTTCGGGTKTSSANCVRDTDNAKMSADMCDASTKPKVVTEDCATDACPPDHYWKATHGECIATCGPGFKLKVLDCVERQTGFIVASSICDGFAVPGDESCQVKPCVPAFNTTTMPPSYALGCYSDIPSPRRVPMLIKIFGKLDAGTIIKRCAEEAHAKGYEFFATQYFTECWAGDVSSANTYYLNGVSENCKDGVGGIASNFVYKIGAPHVVKSVPPVVKLGCFKDDLKSVRPMPEGIDNLRLLLNWSTSNLNAPAIISRCAVDTSRRNWNVFGVQYYGECWSGENADRTYNRAGTSSYCLNGLGTLNEYYVYAFYKEE